ncbi:flagellar FliJ protein [Natronincola peptidivorans]|uniref:Flagellar FliJ protein n=1 Tax=Natronincola peptidivorans TaxID=426128 RepID=A0A1H9YER8_9FIRM|nr:flagellar FliJ family protein [Natronincola peptidivorans]SES67397.1 flagellar FliJ protein [Natronincola peptidivorans]
MTEKFSYRFNNILKIKEKIEEDKKHIFASEQKRLEIEKKSLETLFIKRENTIDKWNKTINNDNIVKISALQRASADIDYLKKALTEQKTRVEKRQEKLNESRKELIEAKKQTKIFEKLKEKDYEVFKILQSKNEAALIDQLVTYKSTVNKGG